MAAPSVAMMAAAKGLQLVEWMVARAIDLHQERITITRSPLIQINIGN
jgi:hypothetical protein